MGGRVQQLVTKAPHPHADDAFDGIVQVFCPLGQENWGAFQAESGSLA